MSDPIDWNEYNKPTLKQIEFAKDIAYTLKIDLPEKKTKASYGKFISQHITEYQKDAYI